MVNSDQMQRICRRAVPCLGAGILVFLAGCVTEPRTPSVQEMCTLLQQKQFVDLTHAFEPGIPHWPVFPDERRETLY